MFLYWRRACKVSANAVGQVGRLASPSERVLLNITTLTPPEKGLVSSSVWSIYPQLSVCCGHTPGKAPPPPFLPEPRWHRRQRGSLLPRRRFRLAFPCVGSPFYSSIRIFHRRSQLCVHRVALVLRGSWRGALGFTGRMVTSALTHDEETAGKQRAGAAAQWCRLLASPLEAEGRAGWSLSTLF